MKVKQESREEYVDYELKNSKEEMFIDQEMVKVNEQIIENE